MSTTSAALEAHPLAALFPLIDGDDFTALVDDVREHGCREPVWLHPDGRILDGRNRHRACREAGIPTPTRTWDGAGSAVEFVLSLNLHRRHLTASQRAVLALEVLPMLEAEAAERREVAGREAALRQQAEARRQRDEVAPPLPAGPASAAVDPPAIPPVERVTEIVPGPSMARTNAARVTQVNDRYVQDAKAIQKTAPDLIPKIASGELNIPQAKREISKRERADIQQQRVDKPTGRYQTIVIDPPWAMEKIGRDVRPNQAGFDYPAMSERELAELELPAEDDCHLYCWVTHKHLPSALRLVEQWGFRYQCLLTWVKNVGFTPFSWMYSTEHVIFARRGNLDMLALGKRLDIHAKVREHSRKPDEFYELVEQVSPGPRIDMFAREPRPGWDVWGNQADHFDEGAA